MKLECFPTQDRPPEIIPGRAQRNWMETFAHRHPYRCLPLTMANTTGWEILCPVGFTVTWNGGLAEGDITFRPEHPFPGFEDFVKSHFTHGTITFHTGYLFRTPPGWSVWAMGPPNHIKDGIQPLSGLIETEWLPFPFTMNWLFTRPGSVHFTKGEPFCFITLVQDKVIENFDIVRRSFDDEPDLRGQYDSWFKLREEFNHRLHFKDPDAVKEAWQRLYFRGEMPDETNAPAPTTHVNKRRLKAIRQG